jgi:Xaa-Pro aminopeptidase
MISSDEPGYYEEDKFGIRLETDIEVVEATSLFNPIFKRKTLKFEPQTLVPFENKLIEICMLTENQVSITKKSTSTFSFGYNKELFLKD